VVPLDLILDLRFDRRCLPEDPPVGFMEELASGGASLADCWSDMTLEQRLVHSKTTGSPLLDPSMQDAGEVIMRMGPHIAKLDSH
jgi:hypothetical protein